MPKCSEVATELRKLADALDKEPETIIPLAQVYFNCKYKDDGKEMFIALARIAPRPLEKSDYGVLEAKRLRHLNEAIDIDIFVEKSKVCTLVEPAKPAVYRCEPLLSDEEDAAISEAVQ